MPETFETVVPIRWSDLDLNGHVNHARIATLLEEARLAWRRSAVAVDGITSFERGQLVASLSLDYRRPVECGPDFVVGITIARIGTKSYLMRFVARQDGQVVVEADTTMVVTDASGSSRALTQVERAHLARFLPAD
jgi:acyl-CoA thioester hydrolase